MATEIWVNIGSGNSLLPDGTKPLPELMLTCSGLHQQKHQSFESLALFNGGTHSSIPVASKVERMSHAMAS